MFMVLLRHATCVSQAYRAYGHILFNVQRIANTQILMMLHLYTTRTQLTIYKHSPTPSILGRVQSIRVLISSAQLPNIAEFVKNQLKIQHDRFNEQTQQNLQLDLTQQSDRSASQESSKIID